MAHTLVVQNLLPLITAVHLGHLSSTTNSCQTVLTAPIICSARLQIVLSHNRSTACVRFAYARTGFFSKRKWKEMEQNGVKMEQNETKQNVNIILSHTVRHSCPMSKGSPPLGSELAIYTAHTPVRSQ